MVAILEPRPRPRRNTALARLVKRYRELRRLSQDQVAERISEGRKGRPLTREAISAIEQGRVDIPERSTLEGLQRVLGIPGRDLLASLGLSADDRNLLDERTERLAQQIADNAPGIAQFLAQRGKPQDEAG